VIREHHQEKLADVTLGEFLLTRFEPTDSATLPLESPTS
jgi:hypothetical protein